MNLKVSSDYFSDCFRCCRPDGSDLFLISSPLLHVFDQTMSKLLFATRTDMVDALKMSDTRLSDVDSFLATLLAEHDARAQLKTLWIANVRSLLGDEDACSRGRSRGGSLWWRGCSTPSGPDPAG